MKLRQMLMLAALLPFLAFANNEAPPVKQIPEELFNMSLEELMDIPVAVPAAITKLAPAETPASITVITEQDIRLTPARNLYDLIEIYVPSAFWMNHEQGPHPGLRGIITNRNYKFLLLVNGRLMNSKEHYGAKSELEQWDLGDIKKIEIIRGPGSVTYGPGAVAGIIKLTTHNGTTAEGKTISGHYVNKYNSRGISFSEGLTTANFNFYTYVSTTKTDGYEADQFLGTNSAEAGFVGKDIKPNDEPLDYFADYHDEPQVKLHWQLEYMKQWRFWFRYTQQGSTWRGNEVKTKFSNGDVLNQQSLRDRQWTLVIEHETTLKGNYDVNTMVSLDSFDAERRGENERHPDPDHVQNFGANYSEDELFLRSVVNWDHKDWVEIAIGAEFSHDRFGPGWGDSEKDMVLGDDGIIISGPNSNAVGPPNGIDLSTDEVFFAGDGWSTNTYSLFGEANLAMSPSFKVLLSGRLDKNSKSDTLFSPRAALIKKYRDHHAFKVILQQSKRINAAGVNFINEKNDEEPQEETLTSLEFAYTGKLSESTTLNIANFWNDAEVIAWNNDIDKSIFVGDLKTYGVEAEVFYKWSKGNIGVNYSFVKQLDWDLNDDLSSSGISYADYREDLRTSNIIMTDNGNDLNNWPNHMLKFYSRLNITPKTTWHVDAHILWDFQGAKDGLEALEDAAQGLPEEAAVEQAISDVESVDAYDHDFRLNTSIAYKPKENLNLRIMVQNLFGSNSNKRYSYDSGMTRLAPHRVRFVEEPRTLGIKVDYKF